MLNNTFISLSIPDFYSCQPQNRGITYKYYCVCCHMTQRLSHDVSDVMCTCKCRCLLGVSWSTIEIK